MSRIIGVDPANSTGVVLVSYGPSGPPVLVDKRIVSVKDIRRSEWIGIARRALSGLHGALEPEDQITGMDPPVCLIEDWDRHSSYNAAVRLAQIQQCWIDASGQLGMPVGLVKVMKWQVATGVNKFTEKKTGKGSRKLAGRRYAASSYECGTCGKRMDGCGHMPQKDDLSDAMCMVRYWIDQKRLKGSTLPF